MIIHLIHPLILLPQFPHIQDGFLEKERDNMKWKEKFNGKTKKGQQTHYRWSHHVVEVVTGTIRCEVHKTEIVEAPSTIKEKVTEKTLGLSQEHNN